MRRGGRGEYRQAAGVLAGRGDRREYFGFVSSCIPLAFSNNAPPAS